MCSAWPVIVCCSTPSACTYNTVRYTYRLGCRPADLRTSRSWRRSAELLLERGGYVIAVVLVNLQLLRGHQVSEALAHTIPYMQQELLLAGKLLDQNLGRCHPGRDQFRGVLLGVARGDQPRHLDRRTRQGDPLHATFTARSESMVRQGT